MTKKKAGLERDKGLRAIGDITERKRDSKGAEWALRGLEEQWRSLVENIPDIIITLDRDGTILFINRTPPGFTMKGTTGAIIYDYVPPEHHDMLRRSLEGVFETGDGHDFEIAAPGPFGRTSWYFSRIGPIVRDGRVVAAAVIATDITERKRAERALRESEERYRDLVEDINEVIYQLDAGGRITYISPVVEEGGGYSPSEIVGRPFTDFVHPDDLSLAVENFRRSASGHPRPNEYRLLSKAGEAVWVRSFGRPIFEGDRVVGVRGVLANITERKLAEEALSREAEDSSSIAAVSRALIQSRPLEDIAQLVLECAKDVTGSTFGFVGYIDPQTGYLVSPTLTKGIWDACEVPEKDIVFKEFSGLWGWVLLKRKPLLTNAPADDPRSSGTPLGHLPIDRFLSAPALLGPRLVGQVAVANSERDYAERDLRLIERLAVLYALALERKEAEEALRESEERYRDLVERSPNAMAVHSQERVLFVNSAGVELFGATAPDQIIGRPIWDFIHPDHVKAAKKRIQTARCEGNRIDLVEEKLVRLDGQAIEVEMAAIPVTYEGKVARQVVLRDITERKRMEAALQSAREELESTVERQMKRGSAYGLSFRELTVLHLVADGRSDRDIGTILGISSFTAQKHIENIRAKMRAASRTEAGVRAVREGLLE